MCTATRKTVSQHEKAEALQDALDRVNETTVPVVSRDRWMSRKEQARLTRELFKTLGLKGIGVTTPNYSMAHVVEVSIPKLEIHCPDYWPHGGPKVHFGGCHVAESDRCPTCRQNTKMREKVEEILARAFPCHDDRSDSQSDYFDHCWSIS